MRGEKLKKFEDLRRLREKIIKQRSAKKSWVIISSGTCGRARGSTKVVQAFEDVVKKHNLEGEVNLRITGCHGFCQAEPNVIISPQEIFYQRIKPEDAEEIVMESVLKRKIIPRLLYVDPRSEERITYKKDIPFYKRQSRLLLENNLMVDPRNIYDYLAIGGYQALSKVLSGMSPEGVIEEIKRSGLRGRGGAGFPAGKKWEACRRAKKDVKYVICNADEGDPGAYMDRSLLEGNPHVILEGILIGAYAIGAREGFIYVRDEYPLAVENVTIAINQAKEYGLLGRDILGSGFNFEIKISRGAGAFVCGEETALMASIEGRKGEPRQRPPFPAQKGLWGRPTNINNVETWANVPLIISKGADWYSRIGTDESKGTKIFSLVGKINNTGLVEVPIGITLREIIYEIGGGIPDKRKFKAVQTGGPSGGCIPKELLNLPVDYETLTKAGSIMGSGGMIVMDEDTCIVDIAKYFLNFLREESCGKCLSCRDGIQRMYEIVTDISEGKGKKGDIELLEELANVVKDASMCGLGQTGANPILSTLRYFRDEYEAHIKYKRCPAAVCKEIISSPCQHTCPIETEVPVYVALIAKGQFKEALDVIRKNNPLPGVCSRVCHHPCEDKCPAKEVGKPISIRGLKRFVVDYGLRRGIKKTAPPKQAKSQKIAIIGSGPAGLAAGYSLVQKGYPVTIFEALSVVGGMLKVGIPEYRLPREILNADLQVIKDAGVMIQTNVSLGKDISVDGLFNQGYEAIFIAVGAHKSLKLDIPGENSEGVLDSLEFLKAVNLGKEVNLGKRVSVIGGGNAAIDAARSAWRMRNCEKVSIIYRRTEMEMPAFKEDVESAIEEGVEIQFLTTPIKILSQNGKLIGIKCIRTKLGEVDESGRRRPIPIKGSEFIIDLDTLILAIGEQSDLSFLNNNQGLKVSSNNRIIVDPETFATGQKGVFAGGDVVTGPNTVIEAISAGKITAISIDKYLRGESLKRRYFVTRPSVYVEPVELTEEEVAETKYPSMPRLSPKERVNNFKEVELGFSKESAVKEARRCLRCDLERKEEKE